MCHAHMLSGNFPLVLSAPHGGDQNFRSLNLDLPARTRGTSEPDFYTMELTAAIQEELGNYEIDNTNGRLNIHKAINYPE